MDGKRILAVWKTNMHTTFNCSSSFIALLLVGFAMQGCSSYQIRGTVVEGRAPGVYVVDSSDARLKQTAVADAQIQATLDPEKLRPKLLRGTQSDEQGAFAIPVDDFGAGLLEYSLGLFVDADGYSGTETQQPIALPGPGKQLLVVVAAGRGKRPKRPGSETENLLDEADKFKKQFE